jgi:hypothetical protein
MGDVEARVTLAIPKPECPDLYLDPPSSKMKTMLHLLLFLFA